MISKKSTYLIILIILSCNYLVNNFTNNLFTGTTYNIDFILLLVQWFWLIFGFFAFNNKHVFNTYKNRKIVYIFITLIVLSTIYPYYVYNQSILASLIAHRTNFSIIALIVLLRIGLKLKEVLNVISFFGFLSSILFLISILLPDLFISNEISQNIDSSDFGASILTPGVYFIMLSFYIHADLCLSDNKNTFLTISKTLFLFSIIVMIQNRQMILITFPILLYVFVLKSNFKYKFIGFIVTMISFYFFYGDIILIYDNLYEETFSQLNDVNYNRFKALDVYLFNYEFNFYTFFFGHGIGASNSKYLYTLSKLNYDGIYFQDIGFIGVFYVYGFFFTVLNFYLILKGGFKKQMPKYVKFWSFGILFIPIFQYWGLMNNQLNIVFVLMFYLIIVNDSLISKKFNAKYNYY